jgi:hypothetical protein
MLTPDKPNNLQVSTVDTTLKRTCAAPKAIVASIDRSPHSYRCRTFGVNEAVVSQDLRTNLTNIHDKQFQS